MSPRQIDRFFRVLSGQLEIPATVILTGAAAGSLWGHFRPSMNVDFAIQPALKNAKQWVKIESAVEKTMRLTGIQANYAQDIDRWGMITLLDYGRHTHPYRRFGKLRVRLLDPAYWSIGKISRYLEPDARDLAAVFRRKKISPTRLVRLWALALKTSSPSTAISQFRKQAEHFLRTYGRRIWGKEFDPEEAIRLLR